MNFIQPRSVAEVMTAALGEAIETARFRACSASATPATHEAVAEQWRHAAACLEAFITGDPGASHDNVIEAFGRVAR
jgi:hypothetical protein